MDSLGPINNSLQTTFAMEQAKIRPLTERFKNHENKTELMKTARQFEGVFVKQLLDEMDKTVDRSGLMDGGSGEEMFRGMLYDKISENISTRAGGSGFGLAETIYRQMEKALPKSERDKPDGESATTKRVHS